MCGIAGILCAPGATGLHAARASEPAGSLAHSLDCMVRAMHHRGPDDHGSLVLQRNELEVGLGNVRLSILDLSPAGHQPMSDDSRWLTYNGEIYNFAQLRDELGPAPGDWRSHTDTEVALRAYNRWGLKCLSKFRGMFGLAVWDDREQQLVLARDPYGIKPVYYYADDDILIFGSEIRAILASRLVPRKLSQEGLASYLRFGSAQAPLTIIEGIKSLQPGHYLTAKLCDGRLAISEDEYWHNETPNPHDDVMVDRKTAIAFLKSVLEESVELHLVSDVPLAVFLSGGIDSTAITALISKVAKEPPKTFTVTFDEPDFSESTYSKYVAERFKTDHHEIRLSEPDLIQMLPAAFVAMDQPTIDGVNTYVISGAVKAAGITVAISGLGGDELFAGYPSFRRAQRLQSISGIPAPARKAAAGIGRMLMGGSVQGRKLWNLVADGGTALSAYTVSRQLFPPEELPSLLGHPGHREGEVHLANGNEGKTSDVLNAVSMFELTGYMANTLLRDADQMGMAHSLEIRVPFIDAAVVPYVLSLPGSWKLCGPGPKPLLREALGDIVPDFIWDRAKMGFTLPFERWMHSSLNEEVDRTISDPAALRGVGITGFAQTVWTRFKDKPRTERWSRPWAIHVLRKWCELNNVTI